MGYKEKAERYALPVGLAGLFLSIARFYAYDQGFIFKGTGFVEYQLAAMTIGGLLGEGIYRLTK